MPSLRKLPNRIITVGGDPKNPDYAAMQAQVSIELPPWRDSGLLLAQFPEAPRDREAVIVYSFPRGQDVVIIAQDCGIRQDLDSPRNADAESSPWRMANQRKVDNKTEDPAMREHLSKFPSPPARTPRPPRRSARSPVISPQRSSLWA